MISKDEILDRAHDQKLFPTTIEKDYVLGWVLYGISKQLMASQWLFKGGTCLKKCYFENYRFSEDLDFTVPPDMAYEQAQIEDAISKICQTIYFETGINCTRTPAQVLTTNNKKGQTTFTVKITYVGPLQLPQRQQQRIKFDITNNEIIVDDAVELDVFHPYSDKPAPPIRARCYSVNDIIAEKTRAICERSGVSRDVYDVVNICRDFRNKIDLPRVRKSLNAKFSYKGLPEPDAKYVFSKIDENVLRANWIPQLQHQVQKLPSVETVLEELQSTLVWLLDFPARSE